jgi:hypothetical protein
MGDKNHERTHPMRSIRFAALGFAGLIAAAAIVPASAATRHKQLAPAQGEFDGAVVTAPVASSVPPVTWQAPNACISDEGYGRYSSCDSGAGN